jgi:hypothetical protein
MYRVALKLNVGIYLSSHEVVTESIKLLALKLNSAGRTSAVTVTAVKTIGSILHRPASYLVTGSGKHLALGLTAGAGADSFAGLGAGCLGDLPGAKAVHVHLGSGLFNDRRLLGCGLFLRHTADKKH